MKKVHRTLLNATTYSIFTCMWVRHKKNLVEKLFYSNLEIKNFVLNSKTQASTPYYVKAL